MVESLFKSVASLSWGLKDHNRYLEYILGSIRIFVIVVLSEIVILQSKIYKIRNRYD